MIENKRVFRIKLPSGEYRYAFGDTLLDAFKNRGGIPPLWLAFMKGDNVDILSLDEYFKVVREDK